MSKQIALTDTWIAKKAKPGWWSDTKLTGFLCYVKKTGEPSFYVRRRINGTLHQRKVATPFNATVNEARNKAMALIASLGEEAPKLKSRTGKRTLGELFSEFKEMKTGQLEKSTLRYYERLLNHNAAHLLDRVPVRDDLHDLHASLFKKDPDGTVRRSVADQTAKAINSVLRFHELDHICISKKRLEKGKSKTDGDGKKKAVWSMDKFCAALDAMPDGPRRDALLFAMTTGLRRCNIIRVSENTASLRWDQIDLEARTMFCRTKTYHGLLPLSEGALELINRQARTSEYVFPIWEARTPEMIEAGVRFHDTREYFGQLAAETSEDFWAYSLLRGDSARSEAAKYPDRSKLHRVADRVNAFLKLRLRRF